jgi:hypothetical protein
MGLRPRNSFFWEYLFRILGIVSLQRRGEGRKLLLLSVTLKIPEILQKWSARDCGFKEKHGVWDLCREGFIFLPCNN